MDERTLDRMERYLFGKMTSGERSAFERDLEENERLRAWYRMVKISYDASERDIEDDLREELEKIRRIKEGGGRIRKLFGLRSVAAVLIVLILAAVYLAWAGRYGDGPLYEQYYAPYTVELMRSGEEGSGVLADASAKFQQGKYREALELLDTVKEGAPDYSEALLIKASVLEGMGRTTQAMDQLEKVSRRRSDLLSDEAEWRLLLLRLKRSDRDRFELLLDSVLNDVEHLYRERAKALKKDSRIPLRNVWSPASNNH